MPLFAIDFDGTLLDPGGVVTPRTKAAVHALVSEGHHVVFATGRSWNESLRVLEQVEHRATAVFTGGAMTVDLRDESVIDRRTMPADVALQACDLLESLDLTPILHQDRTVGGVDFVYGPRHAPEPVLHWHRQHRLIVRMTDDWSAVDHAATLRVTALGPSEQIDRAQRELDALGSDRAFAYQVDLANLGVRLLEAFGPGVTKWTAIERLASRLNLTAADVVAIGDDSNDLQMIERAGRGVAMGNAKPHVKAVANEVIGSHADDGLAAFLEQR